MELSRPTDAQLNAIHAWAKWKLDALLLREALAWLEKNATRRQVSQEISRIRGLYYDHKLDSTTFFESPVWDGFKVKNEE